MEEKRFPVFVAVGVGCALVDIGLMKLLIWVGFYYLIATTFGFAVGLVMNFLLHTHVTFKKKYSHGTLARFMIVVLINYALTLSMVFLLQILLNMPTLGKLISLPMVAANGFLLSKKWVFR